MTGLLRAAMIWIAAVMAGSAAKAQSFVLEGVAFTPSVYLETGELQQTVAPWLNRPITLEDVRSMTAAVQALYTRSGILTARVLLLPQTVTTGILELTLVEATIGTLAYEGLEETNLGFLRRTISIREGEQPDYNQLEQDFRIYEIMYDFAPQLTFSRGDSFGKVNAVISGETPEKISTTLSADNYGSENTGSARVTAQVHFPNVTGERDAILAQVQASEGARNADVTYLRPIGSGGGVAYVTANYSEAEIISGDFAAVSLTSSNQGATVGYRRPFSIRPDSHWMVEGFATAEKSTSQLTDLPFQEQEIQEYGLQVSYQRVRNGRSLTASLGVKAGNVETVETSETEGRYVLAHGTLGHARQVGEELLFDVSLAAQYATNQNLASPRLFSAGGPATVRGYPRDIRSGDTGAILRMQLTGWKPREFKDFDGTWTPFGFLDAAVVIPYREEGGYDSSADNLASLGVGARASFGDKITGLAFIGIPVLQTEGFTDVGKPMLSVGLDYAF